MVHENSGNTNVINYDLFVAIFGMLTLLYLIPATLKESFQVHPLLPLILDILNVIFWFCAAVATAAELGAHSCSNHVSSVCRAHNSEGFTDFYVRTTLSQTASHLVPRSAARRPVHPPLSSSSASRHLSSQPSSLASVAVVLPTLAQVSDAARL